MSSTNWIMRMSPVSQPYAWGMPAEKSLAGHLRSAEDKAANPDPQVPVAELWMGLHPAGMGQVETEDGRVPIDKFLRDHPDFLAPAGGPRGDINFEKPLSFLLKVLSIDSPLSLQVHPDLETAVSLHSERPDIYKDPNHKPEICIALGECEALCGVRDWNEIATILKEVPILLTMMGTDFGARFSKAIEQPLTATATEAQAAVKALFTRVLTASQDEIVESLDAFIAIDKTNLSPLAKATIEFFLHLHDIYPGDRGCIAAMMLRKVTLAPGECLFLGPNVIHAYLSGQMVECMATSDNVIRGGLTPKFIDTDLLLKLLRTDAGGAARVTQSDYAMFSEVKAYRPPVADFEVLRIVLQPDNHLEGLRPCCHSPGIAIVIQGKGEIWTKNGKERQHVKQGDVFLLHRGIELSMKSADVGNSGHSLKQMLDNAPGDLVVFLATQQTPMFLG